MPRTLRRSRRWPPLNQKAAEDFIRRASFYRAQESAEERARGKKLASDLEGVPGLVKIHEDRLQEYESSLLDIPTDREKDYFQGLGYDEAFRQMMMSWGVVRVFCLWFLFFHFITSSFHLLT